MRLEEAETVIRKGTRKILEGRSEKWKSLFVYWTDDRVVVSRYMAPSVADLSPEGVLLQFRWADVPPEARRLVATLVDMLHNQSTKAYLAGNIAKFDIDLQRKRADEGANAGRDSAKDTRPAVEQQVRACLRRREDPKDYVAAWAEDYGYTKRQIRNIIARIRAE